MTKLIEQHCEACRADAALLSQAELELMMADVPDWTRKVHNGVEKLIREFKFGNFKQALEFTNAVAELAERENHHPTLVTEWGKVTVYWWTHKINGLHLNDFIMAARTDLATAFE